MKGVRKPFVEDRDWYVRRVELKVVPLVGKQAQNVDVIFDLLVLQAFFSATYKVRV